MLLAPLRQPHGPGVGEIWRGTAEGRLNPPKGGWKVVKEISSGSLERPKGFGVVFPGFSAKQEIGERQKSFWLSL